MVKLPPCVIETHAMKRCRKVEVRLHSFLTSALGKVSGKCHAPAASPPGKSLRYPFERGLGGPQSWSGRGGETKPCTREFCAEYDDLRSLHRVNFT